MKAIAFVRRDISGSQTADDIHALRRYARSHGYTIEALLNVLPGGALDPGLRLINAVHTHDAAAVLVPQLNHIQSTRHHITEICGLVSVAPEKTWPRGHLWPRPESSRHSGREPRRTEQGER
ncbi:hypothetical protein OH799_32750 [Nocardia sp. NBC_00881]|uniref:hypothetical protein n=1 Tax=Nocardia sp. NBC_00881 TaxID=2975995 RepID=UPI00386F6AA1|nr:hypothetical protein OH799_32750 [Nocardia sp. NBC_00881]